MIKIPTAYRFPLFIALLLHVVLILFLFMHMPAAQFRSPEPQGHPKMVQAVAVDAKQVAAQVAEIKRTEARKKARERDHVRRLRAKAIAARKVRLREERNVARLRAQRKQLKKQKAVEVAKLKRLQKKRTMALKAQANRLQAQLKKQQLLTEQRRLAKAKSRQMRGVVDRYKAAILQAIGQKWVVPGGANQNLSSIYLIQLAPGGVVLRVTLLHSSGNAALDHSAQTAIYKASPLPVPKAPALFDNFRRLRLTVSPKTVVRG